MSTTEEKKSVTGLDTAENRKEAEYDLLTALLEAADYKTSDDNIIEVDLKRNGKFLFKVHLHPVSDQDAKLARKKATKYIKNPAGAKYPLIEGDFDSSVFNSWLIYLATTEEDQEKIWGNTAIMNKFGLKLPYETVEKLLTIGEKARFVDEVMKISGMKDDDDGDGEDEIADEVDFAKN